MSFKKTGTTIKTEIMIRLGDLVERITYYTGIKWVVKKVSKIFAIDCGCDQRHQEWNNIKIDRNGISKDE